MNRNTEMNPSPLVQYLNKPAADFTRADLIRYISDHDIEMVNFRYCGWDGRLKTLNFVINSKKHLDDILSYGERVDGSSLFSFIEAGSSDLYVVPRYKTAFVNPFSEKPSLDILCSYYNKDGEPLVSSPEYIQNKAHQVLEERTGYTLQAMGELEYYIISPVQGLFQATDQRGYHEGDPFTKWSGFRRQAMLAIAHCGGLLKYGHSEVGNFTLDNMEYEQNEIEFLPTALDDAADQMLIAKWILRTLAWQSGVNLTFAPKITTGKAGSGLHIHLKLMKEGKNIVAEEGKLTDPARKLIAGILDIAPSITAFGNINPMSYFRLVPNQEAPTSICWGDRNRSVLVRVPLGWSGNLNMASDANPQETEIKPTSQEAQTIEYRGSDGSADIHLLLAGLAVAARHGLEMPSALKMAEDTYVDVNIFHESNRAKRDKLLQLPSSCSESAQWLSKQQDIYLQHNVFTPGTIKGIVSYLEKFNDRDIRQRLENNPEEMKAMVARFFHCG